MDDCVSSRRGYFYLKTSISSFIYLSQTGIHSSGHATVHGWLELSYGAFAHSNYSSLMAISTFSILEVISSASLPGDPYIRSGHDSREAHCESTVVPQLSYYCAGTTIMTMETEEVCENIFSYTNKNIQSNFLFSRDPVFSSASNNTFLSFQCHMFETCDYDDLSLRSSMKEPVDMNFTRPELGVQHVEFSSFLTVRHTTTCPERSAWQLRDGKDLIRPSYDDTGICPIHTKLSSQKYYLK